MHRASGSWGALALVLLGCAASRGLGSEPVETDPRCQDDVLVLQPELSPFVRVLGHVCLSAPPHGVAAWSDGEVLRLRHVEGELVDGGVELGIGRHEWSPGGGLRSSAPCTHRIPAAEGAESWSVGDLTMGPEGTALQLGVVAGSRSATALHIDRSCGVREAPMDAFFTGELVGEEPEDWMYAGFRDGTVAAIFRDDGLLRRDAAGDTPLSLRQWEDGLLESVVVGHGLWTLRWLDADLRLRGELDVNGGLGARFQAVEGRGLVPRGPVGPSSTHALWRLRTEGARVELEGPVEIASEAFVALVPVRGTPRMLVQHERGFFLVE